VQFALRSVTRFDGRWAPSHGNPFTALRFGLQQSRQRRRAVLRGMEQTDARLSGTGAAVSCAGRRTQCRYLYLEVKCLGCSTHQTVPLNIVRRPKATPIHELERYMRCKDCSTVQAEPSDRTAGDEDFRQRSGVSSLAVSPRSPSRKRANRGRPCVIRIASIRLPQRYGLKLSSRQSCELLGRVDSPEWICSHFF
jgi:hypothetical protein